MSRADWRTPGAYEELRSLDAPGFASKVAVELLDDVVAVAQFAQCLFEIPLNLPDRSTPLVRQIHLFKELQTAHHQPPIVGPKADMLRQ